MPRNSSSLGQLLLDCRTVESVVSVYFSFTATKALTIVPICVVILHLGLQRWRQQRSFNFVNHCDVFTYHLAAMELFWAPVFFCFLCGLYFKSILYLSFGATIFSFCFYGESFFHMLTCLERYLAVVHPIIYVRLKRSRGVKIRNVIVTSSWIISFGMSSFHMTTTADHTIYLIIFFLAVSMSVTTFCSLSVLCVLNRPGPGDGGAGKEQVDPKKKRAFYTITVIASVLWLWFLPFLVSNVVYKFPVDGLVNCMLFPCATFLSLPSGFALPLLYLHRNGKCLFCFQE